MKKPSTDDIARAMCNGVRMDESKLRMLEAMARARRDRYLNACRRREAKR